MTEIVESVLDAVPWLGPVLAWSLAILTVSLILMVPAYFILWPFFDRARRQSAAYIDRIRERIYERRTDRADRLDTAADEFLNDGGLWRVGHEGAGQWAATVAGISRRLKRLRKPVRKAAGALNRLDRRIPGLTRRLQNAEPGPKQALPQIGGADSPAASAAAVRVAWLKLALAGGILFALILVNAGFLSKILEDMGLVPPSETVFGIRLSYLLAMVITLVSAGIGVAHGAMRSDDPEKFSLAPWGFLLLALGLATVSGFFFSRIVPASATFSVPFIGYEMLQSHILFIWGWALELTLFGLGFVSYEAGATILRSSPTGLLDRELRKLGKRHERYAGALQLSEKAVIAAKVTAKDADQMIYGPAQNAASVGESIAEALHILEALRTNAPDWAGHGDTALTRTEVHQLAQTAGLWVVLSLLGAAVMTVTGLTCFAAYDVGLDPLLLWMLSIGQAMVFFGAGFLIGADEIVVRGKEGERKVIGAPRFSRLAGYALTALLTLIYVFVLFTIARLTGLMTIWALNLMVGLFLVAAGYQLSPLLNVLRLWLWRVWNVVVLVVEALWLGLVRLLHGIVLVGQAYPA